VGSNISEEHTAFIFKPDVTSVKMLIVHRVRRRAKQRDWPIRAKGWGGDMDTVGQ
jgi:hypothetical protein